MTIVSFTTAALLSVAVCATVAAEARHHSKSNSTSLRSGSHGAKQIEPDFDSTDLHRLDHDHQRNSSNHQFHLNNVARGNSHVRPPHRKDQGITPANNQGTGSGNVGNTKAVATTGVMLNGNNLASTLYSGNSYTLQWQHDSNTCSTNGWSSTTSYTVHAHCLSGCDSKSNSDVVLQAPGASLTTGATNVITVAPWMIGPGTWVTEIRDAQGQLTLASSNSYNYSTNAPGVQLLQADGNTSGSGMASNLFVGNGYQLQWRHDAATRYANNWDVASGGSSYTVYLRCADNCDSDSSTSQDQRVQAAGSLLSSGVTNYITVTEAMLAMGSWVTEIRDAGGNTVLASSSPYGYPETTPIITFISSPMPSNLFVGNRYGLQWQVTDAVRSPHNWSGTMSYTVHAHCLDNCNPYGYSDKLLQGPNSLLKDGKSDMYLVQPWMIDQGTWVTEIRNSDGDVILASSNKYTYPPMIQATVTWFWNSDCVAWIPRDGGVYSQGQDSRQIAITVPADGTCAASDEFRFNYGNLQMHNFIPSVAVTCIQGPSSDGSQYGDVFMRSFSDQNDRTCSGQRWWGAFSAQYVHDVCIKVGSKISLPFPDTVKRVYLQTKMVYGVGTTDNDKVGGTDGNYAVYAKVTCNPRLS